MPAPQYEDDELMRQVLMRHRYLDFVRRILNPQMYPTVTSDPRRGRHIAYPNILFNRDTRSLQWLQPREALIEAVRRGEFIQFPTAERAAQFSEKYKRGSAGMQAGR